MEQRIKAKQLVEKYRILTQGLDGKGQLIDYMSDAKQCALIVSDEIIEILSNEPPRPSNKFQMAAYWADVKREINLL